MLEVIHARALQGFAENVRELNGDPEALLVGVGIAPDRVPDAKAYIPYSAHAALLEHAAEVLECPDFALRLSNRRGIEVLGAVGLVARHAATVQDGLQAMAKHLHVFCPAVRSTLSLLPGGEVRYTHSMLVDLPVPMQVTELALAAGLQATRALIGQHLRPLRVFLPHAPVSSPVRYREFFDAEVAFEQTHCSFDFRSSDLARPLAGSDPLVQEVATRLLESSAYARASTPETALRTIVTGSLAGGHCTLVEVAHQLYVHPRTLQRHLASQGLSFEHVVADVRRHRARDYLENTTLPLSDIAALLGYSEQSSLSRACRAWFGTTPQSVRHERRAPTDTPTSGSGGVLEWP